MNGEASSMVWWGRGVMRRKFEAVISKLAPLCRKLEKMPPVHHGNLPGNMPESGVYLFSEVKKHLYVGRSRNIRNRYGQHHRPSSTHNSAPFAFLLAREATGQIEASYDSGSGNRKALMQDEDFKKAFEDAKVRIRKMDFRYVEETDPTRQALLEIYCAVVLKTPYNKFRTH